MEVSFILVPWLCCLTLKVASYGIQSEHVKELGYHKNMKACELGFAYSKNPSKTTKRPFSKAARFKKNHPKSQTRDLHPTSAKQNRCLQKSALQCSLCRANDLRQIKAAKGLVTTMSFTRVCWFSTCNQSLNIQYANYFVMFLLCDHVTWHLWFSSFDFVWL